MAVIYKQKGNTAKRLNSFSALNKSKLNLDTYTIPQMCYDIFLGPNGTKQCNMAGLGYYLGGVDRIEKYIVGQETKIELYKELRLGLTIYNKSNIIGEIIGIAASIKYAVKWLEYTARIYLEEIDE